jgi:Arf-GAP/coiled-coil/ANK repeat/PH domain-containing protein
VQTVYLFTLFSELSKLRVAKAQFDTMSNSIQDALAKRASISRNCSQALKEARNSLTAVGTCFAHQSLDYVAQINIAHARKSHVFLDAVSFFRGDLG